MSTKSYQIKKQINNETKTFIRFTTTTAPTEITTTLNKTKYQRHIYPDFTHHIQSTKYTPLNRLQHPNTTPLTEIQTVQRTTITTSSSNYKQYQPGTKYLDTTLQPTQPLNEEQLNKIQDTLNKRKPNYKQVIIITDRHHYSQQLIKQQQSLLKGGYTIYELHSNYNKNYQYQIKQDQENFYNQYGFTKQYTPKQKDYIKEQAFQYTNRWQINNGYQKNFIILIDTSEHLNILENRIKTKNNKRKLHTESIIKQLIQLPHHNIIIKDIQTGETIKHQTKKGITDWDTINQTYTDIIHQLHLQTYYYDILDQDALDKYLDQTRHYEDMPTTQVETFTTYEPQGTNFINTFINYTTTATKLDREHAKYLYKQGLLKTNEQQIKELQEEELRTYHALRELYHLYYREATKEVLELLEHYESIQSKIIELQEREELKQSYEAINYKL